MKMYVPKIILERDQYIPGISPRTLPDGVSSSFAACKWGWFADPGEAMKVAKQMALGISYAVDALESRISG